MAKPKSPLLSFGARGSISDSLTFQKRGRLTIARRKPIPSDPKTDLQLAQRQVYRDAVTAWNLLTTEEKEAYRGVCPGLTPYQCYMKTALVPPEPEPPPEEQIEEQPQHSSDRFLFSGSWQRVGQRLFIPNRKVTKLAFYLRKQGSPTGDVTLTIRKVTDDSIISSKVWGDAADLPAVSTLEEVEFDTPQTINEEVRILCQFSGGSSGNSVALRYQNTDVKPGEYHTETPNGAYTDRPTLDVAYRYKYYEVE